MRRRLLLIVPAVFTAVFFALPVVSIVLRGLRTNQRWDLDGVRDVLVDPVLRRVMWFTVWQALASTVLTLAVALPGAHVLARISFRGRRVVSTLVVVPFVLPTVVVGSAFLSLIGPRSPIGVDLSGTTTAILIAHAFFNYAVVVRVVGGLWSQMDPRIEDAARVLGAGRLEVLRSVTLPLLRPAIGAAALVVFLFSFTSFGVIQVLGSARQTTLEVEIYTRTARLLDLHTAAVLAIVQLLAVSSLLLIYSRLERRAGVPLRFLATRDMGAEARTTAARLWLAGNLTVMAVLLGLPLAVLVERSFATGDGHGLAHWRALRDAPTSSRLFVPPVDAIANSVRFALAATVIAVVVGGCAAIGLTRGHGPIARAVDGLLTLPLGTSAVTIGFGFLIALDQPPLDLRGKALIIPIAQGLVAIPFMVRTVLPVLRSIDDRMREAAAVLGASPARVWREVDLPILSRAILVGAGFAFAISLGEFGATLFVSRADTPTVPIAIFRLLSQPGSGSFGVAMALSTVLMGLTAAAVLLIERAQLGRLPLR